MEVPYAWRVRGFKSKMFEKLKKQRFSTRELISRVPSQVIEAYVPFTQRPAGYAQLEGYLNNSRNYGKIYSFGGESFISAHYHDCKEEGVGWSSRGESSFVKFYFFFGGSLTITFDGFGEYELRQPQLFIVSCPLEMKKFDLVCEANKGTASLLHVGREFVLSRMGVDPGVLPEPLRSIFEPDETPFSVYSFPLTPSLVNATRTIFNDGFPSFMMEQYYQSKAIEIMCLIIAYLENYSKSENKEGGPSIRVVNRLQAVQEYITSNFSKEHSLEELAKEVGLSKSSLVSGFRQHYGMSVFDYIKNEKMTHAFQLLRDKGYTVAQVAYQLGYTQPGNFSTAFKSHFGYSPTQIPG